MSVLAWLAAVTYISGVVTLIWISFIDRDWGRPWYGHFSLILVWPIPVAVGVRRMILHKRALRMDNKKRAA